MKPLHPCGYPSCPTLTSHARCDVHRVERYKDPEQQKYYGSREWKLLRSQVRREEPICRICKRKPTTNVDHIDGNWRNRDRKNLRGLCGTCDRRHTGAQHYRKRLTT